MITRIDWYKEQREKAETLANGLKVLTVFIPGTDSQNIILLSDGGINMKLLNLIWKELTRKLTWFERYEIESEVK